MAQNRSSAVMQQRIEPHDSLDYFPTPPWATRALCEFLSNQYPLNLLTAWEPACGEGDMAKPLAEYFEYVAASDVHDYGFGAVEDFLIDWPVLSGESRRETPDFIISNPPFRLAEEFIQLGRDRSKIGVAMLLRTSFLEGQTRHADLFSKSPPTYILQFAERVPMFKGRLDPEGSTATSYCWIIFEQGNFITEFHWIPPCRKRLERDGDYPAPDVPVVPCPLFENQPEETPENAPLSGVVGDLGT